MLVDQNLLRLGDLASSLMIADEHDGLAAAVVDGTDAAEHLLLARRRIMTG